MKKLLISFIILFAGLLLITQTAPLTSAAELNHPMVVATPSKLKSFTVEDAGLTSMDVSWKKHTFDGTQIRVMTEDGTLVLKKNTKKPHSIVITGLTAGITYTIKARAYNIRRDGEKKYGKYSTTVTATTEAEPVEDTNEEDNQQEEENIPETFDVSITNFAFSPESLEVQVGDTVRFTDNDSTSHTASEENGVFNTGTLSSGETAEIVMDQTGTFGYFCAFHHFMTGSITVIE